MPKACGHDQSRLCQLRTAQDANICNTPIIHTPRIPELISQSAANKISNAALVSKLTPAAQSVCTLLTPSQTRPSHPPLPASSPPHGGLDQRHAYPHPDNTATMPKSILVARPRHICIHVYTLLKINACTFTKIYLCTNSRIICVQPICNTQRPCLWTSNRSYSIE